MFRVAGSAPEAKDQLALGDGFVLDLARGELYDAAGRPAELRAQALRVLLVLGRQAGQVVGKDVLLKRIWGDVVVTEDSLVQAVGDIRRALGDVKHQRLRTVPRRGYQLVLPETDVDSATPMRHRHRLTLVTAGVLLVVLAAAIATWTSRPREQTMPRSLAILPFESDAGTEGWFVDGVTGDLTSTVGSWRGLTVIGRGTMASYRGKDPDPRAVGRELGVRFVLTGRARRDGDSVRLAVTLVDAHTGQSVWSEMRDMPRAELAELVGDVAGGIARALTVELGDAVAADARTLRPEQVEADDLAMQGLAELLRGVSAENFERARQLSERAVAVDPLSVRGFAGVSMSNSNLVLFEWATDRAAAIARAEQALAHLDKLEPNGQLTGFARASLTNIRGDWVGLAAIAAKLIEAYPNEPTAHHHRCSALVRLAQFDESIAACARAMRISPRDTRVPIWNGLTAFNHFLAGRPAEAEQHARLAVIGNPRIPFYAVVLTAAIADQGRHEEAEKVLVEALARAPAYRQANARNYWVATDPRFVAGRDRMLALAGERGLPP
jgi:adenylate cyclase